MKEITLTDKQTKSFLCKVYKTNNKNDCWLWTRHRNAQGYGRFSTFRLGPLMAHRVAWTIESGKIPSGLLVLHKCDNPPCCNPNHLFLGTHLDNIIDAVKKNRWSTGDKNGSRTHPEKRLRGDNHPARKHPEWMSHGSSHPRARFKDEDITEMRRLFSEEKCSLLQLEEKYKASNGCIYAIITRRTWKHIKP